MKVPWSLHLLFLQFWLLSECWGYGGLRVPILRQVTAPRILGEAPHWDSVDNVLYYVDIDGQTLYRYDPATNTEKSIYLNGQVSLVLPLKDQRRRFVVGLGRDLILLTWDWDSGYNCTSLLVSVDQDKPRNRFNDGKADARGRIWAGTRGEEEPKGVFARNKGGFYRVDQNPWEPCRADVALSPVSISNGLAWSHDNRIMFYIDTLERRVDAFDFDLDRGLIANRRTVFEFGNTPGSPDGMTIDENGNLWIACVNGSRVIQVDPRTGQLLRQIKLPVVGVTSVVFGGKMLDTLYITTLRVGLNASELKKQPLAGALFQVTNLGVRGTPSKPAVVACQCAQSQPQAQFGFNLVAGHFGTGLYPRATP